MLRSYVRLAMFALGLLVAVQVPGFIHDYQLRVDAHRVEAGKALDGFKETATRFFDGDLNALVAHYRGSADPVFQRDADSIEVLMRRAKLFDTEWKALQGPWHVRAWHILLRPNDELLEETLDKYDYRLTLSPESIAWGLGGGLLMAWTGEMLLLLAGALAGVGGYRRAARRHWG
ncbi:hypothetical protein D3C78_629100 [compost metagenome]